jgi:hypothetical protein
MQVSVSRPYENVPSLARVAAGEFLARSRLSLLNNHRVLTRKNWPLAM